MNEERQRQGVRGTMRRRATVKRQLAEELDAIACPDSTSKLISSTGSGSEADPGLRALLETATVLTHTLRQPVPAPPGKLQFGRAQLLATSARQPRRHALRERLRVEVRFLGRLAVALIALLVMLAPLSPRIVGAARESMPGHLFYPLKLHMERVQFRGAEEPDVRLSLGLAFLGERVAEAQALAGTGRTLDYETVSEVGQLVNQVLHALAQTPETTMDDTLIYVSRQLGAYLSVLETLNAQASQPNAAGLSQMKHAVERGYLLTLSAREDPEGFRSAYQAGRPEQFLLPGDNPLGGRQAPPNTDQEN